MNCILFFFTGVLFVHKFGFTHSEDVPELILATVATEETDGLKRLQRSAVQFGHKLHIFGLGEKWQGGNMNFKGGAQKIRLLRNNLKAHAHRTNALILFIDAYDVIINADAELILRNFFLHFGGKRIVFGAESYCWPDRTLARKYPPVTFGERYLNSGMFIGYAKDVLTMLDIAEKENLADNDDDQLFYTKLYINDKIRRELNMALDSLSIIFQNLNGMQESVTLQIDALKNYQVYNKLYNTHPLLIHGNGPSKIHLNELSNYLMITNVESAKDIEVKANKEQGDYADVAVAVFIMKPIPYVEEFLESLVQLDYPKGKMHLRISNNQRYNQHLISEFAKEWEEFYASLKTFNLDAKKEHVARSEAFEWAERKATKFLFILDADSHLTNSAALKHLITSANEDENHFGILSPLIIRPGTLYSNFWGAISDSGYYARSFDYVDIVQGNRRGIWNVPFVGSAILISARKIPSLRKAYAMNPEMDADLSFAQFCRSNGQFMYIDSSMGPDFYGFLINSDGFSQLPEQAHLNLEIYDFPNNKELWEHRYIHPDYFPLLKPEATVPLPCPDAYDFPFISERFCKEIIQIMEDFGQWSDGVHHDRRIQGGYENVPTRDIHMNQVGLERHWLKILDDYIAPMQEKVFIGFYQRPIQANMMFVVRYHPDEQASLRPHHDASTYSIDVALNRRGIDYEGGGVRFIRYNCTLETDKIGWTMLFPGRLTHLHEGLPTTSGTRYILVSFINP